MNYELLNRVRMQKMYLEETKYKELLQTKIEEKFGGEIKYSRDCKLLSEQVYKTTGRQLSVSTIKRFFGLILSPFKPSKYTLDTLSQFLGPENWEGFVESNQHEDPDNTEEHNLEMLKESFRSITETSYLSLSRKSRYSPQNFIYRDFAESHFEEFMRSGKTGTMLIAPDGYGKSSVLLQWMNTYFWGETNKYSDNIVCLIDGRIFFTFYNKAQENELLAQLFDFDFKTIQNLRIKQKHVTQRIRYFLIIDDIDRIFSVREKNFQLAENIMRLIMLNIDNPWFRIILTCRPEDLEIFSSIVRDTPLLAEAFFNVNFSAKNHSDAINVALFSNSEIRTALSNPGSTLPYFHLSMYYPDIFYIIPIPSFFSFFVNDEGVSEANFSEVSFLNHLIQHFYYSNPFAEEKQQLIKRFMSLSSRDGDCTSIKKEILLEGVECRLAYNDLINTGLFYEFFDASETPAAPLKVRFSNNIIFEYLLARELIKEKGEVKALLNWVITNYKEALSLQHSLLKWFVKIAFFEEDFDFLTKTHWLMERQVNVPNELSNEFMPGPIRSIHSAFIEGLRTNKATGEALMSVFAESQLGQKLYFEDYFDMDNLMFFPESSLDIYAQNNKTADGEMTVRFIRFIKGFYSVDYVKCSLEFERISRINYTDLKSALTLGYYFSSWFLYASLSNSQSRDEILRMFLAGSKALRSKGTQNLRFNPGYEYFVIYNLNAGNFFDEVRIVAEYLSGMLPQNKKKRTCFDRFFELCYARALLHTGETGQAMERFRKEPCEDFPFHIKHFLKLHVNLAKTDFLEYQKNIPEASGILAETRSLAKLMGYTYFIQKSNEIESNLLKLKKENPGE